MLSLIESAKLSGHDPWAYLKDVFERLPTLKNRDLYDALISRRCYKPPLPHDESMEIMRKSRGTMFDPTVFDAFVSIEPEIQDIAMRYRDDSEVVVGDR